MSDDHQTGDHRMQFTSKEQFANYLLNRCLQHAETHEERLKATMHVAQSVDALWTQQLMRADTDE